MFLSNFPWICSLKIRFNTSLNFTCLFCSAITRHMKALALVLGQKDSKERLLRTLRHLQNSNKSWTMKTWCATVCDRVCFCALVWWVHGNSEWLANTSESHPIKWLEKHSFSWHPKLLSKSLEGNAQSTRKQTQSTQKKEKKRKKPIKPKQSPTIKTACGK